MELPRRYYIRILIVVALLFVGFLVYTNDPSSSFPTGISITVQTGDTLTSIAKDLKTKHLIRSTTLFRGVVMLFAGEQKLVAGDYYFDRPISTYVVAYRLVNGNFDLSPIRVTIQEGISMEQIATLLAPKFKHFSVADFMKYSPAKEGYLFPDTYFFMPDIKADGVIKALQKNFEEKIKTVEPIIAASGKSENDVIIMASILEKEAGTAKDRQIVSSILWKRIKIGMPLQVDSTLDYVTGRISSELTKADLKMDSPYNTYVLKGLPITPIANPGLQTIVAAATPTTTPYLYYLSDKNGVIHYAATFADHVKNRRKFLN
jgi:UPF0755 protein